MSIEEEGGNDLLSVLDISNTSSRKCRTQRVEDQKNVIVDVTRVSS